MAYLAESGQDRQRLPSIQKGQSLKGEMKGARKWHQLELRELLATKMKRDEQMKMKEFD